MITQPNELEEKLTNLLSQTINEIHSNYIIGNKDWTYAFKKNLANLGTSYDYKVCTSGFKDEYENEWLFDMVWYKEDSEKRLIDVPLVVESEWGSSIDFIKFDFEKLLLANSSQRLMICQSHPSKVNVLKEYFEQAIKLYQLNKSGDRYLIAILHYSKEIEEFEFVVYEKK